MANSSFQASKITDANILVNNAIAFDNIIESEGDITYNSTTGVLTLSEIGKYTVYWWVATQSSQSNSGISFSLVSSQGDLIPGTSPIKNDEVVGFAVINVTTVPFTLTIQNTSASSVYLPTQVATKANLMLIKIPDEPVVSQVAYGGLGGENNSILLPASEEVQLPLPVAMELENVTASNNTLTIGVTGNYLVSYMINYDLVTSSFAIQSGFRVNGMTSNFLYQAAILTTTNSTMISCSAILPLTVGDVVDLYLISATEQQVLFMPGDNSLLTIVKIS